MAEQNAILVVFRWRDGRSTKEPVALDEHGRLPEWWNIVRAKRPTGVTGRVAWTTAASLADGDLAAAMETLNFVRVIKLDEETGMLFAEYEESSIKLVGGGRYG